MRKYRFRIIVLAALVLLSYFLKKAHFDNFYKGNRELKELLSYDHGNNVNSRPQSPFIYIAHAGGGYKGNSYLNNLEAINNSYRLGITYIEIDFHYSADSVVVLSHDYVTKTAQKFLKDKNSGTHLTLYQLLEWMYGKEIFLITDIKKDNLKILRFISTEYPELIDKVIPQAYTINEIYSIKRMGYQKVIFTNYVALYPNVIIKKLSDARVLFGLTLPYDFNFKSLQYFNDLKKMKTPILTHTINDLKIASELSQSGCNGIYTDFLLSK